MNEQNHESLKRLKKSINFSQGELSLIFLRCNYQFLRENITQEIKNNHLLKVIELPKSSQNIYQYIKEQIVDKEVSTLVIFGLDSVENLDDLLRKVNLAREEFRNNFHIPILFWVTEDCLKKIQNLAPDFHNWATTFNFLLANDDLIEFLNQVTRDFFINSGYPNSKELEIYYTEYYQEIIIAYKKLQKSLSDLPSDLEASIEFILGFHKYKTNNIDAALEHYYQSLIFWKQQNENNFEQGILELYIAIGHYRKVNPDWLQSKNYFQDCFATFDKAQRQDLVSENISLLCRALRNLREWDQLYDKAGESQQLHYNSSKQLQLVEDYGFLAEAELEKSKLDSAREYAEKALVILDQISEERPSLRCSHPRFILAKLQEKQQQVSAAIYSLEKARKEINRQYDPYTYSEILDKLKQIYFSRKEYLKAAEIKQKLIRFEQQYGLRTFIGIGSLQASRSPVRDKSKLTEEIYLPAREQDIQNIINKLNLSDCKLLVVHGFSGVGKSSLLKAGLVPALKNHLIDNTPVFPILIRHYTDWFENIKKSLVDSINEIKESFDNDINQEISSTTLTVDKHLVIDKIIDNFFTKHHKYLKYHEKRVNILIFDQFEEFLLIEKSKKRRKEFYNFLCDCINYTNTKIIFSLREDYLYNLLEIERIVRTGGLQYPIDAFKNILHRDNRYELGNWSKEEAQEVIKALAHKSPLQLDISFLGKIINHVVEDSGQVRPIELQIIGYELQKRSRNSNNYSCVFNQKEEIVKQYLYHEVIDDCGKENQLIAIYILYFLTGNNDTRPLKSKSELIIDLQRTNIIIQKKQIDLVLNILVTSRIVLEVPEKDITRYQLVHDYLVSYIRQLQETEKLELEIQRREQQEKERKHSLKWQRNIATIGIFSLAIMAIITLTFARDAESQKETAQSQKTETQKEEIKAISKASEALFASNQRFDALKEALDAGIKLKKITECPGGEMGSICDEVSTALQQPIYWLVERNRLDGHKGLIWNIAFSPDGEKIASASYDRTIRVWSPDGKELDVLGEDKTAKQRHKEKIYSVTFSPDNQIIASADFDGHIKLWKLNQKSKKFEFFKNIKDNSLDKAHKKGVYSLGFSADGGILASASRDGKVKLWKVTSENNVHVSPILKQTLENAHDKGVNSVAFSPNGNILATGGRDNTVKLWKKDSNGKFENSPDKELPEKFDDFVWSLAWSPDGKKIAIASRDSTVKLWDLKSDKLFPFCSSSDCEKEPKSENKPKSHNDRVMSVSFSKDGKLIASGSLDDTVKIWKLNNNKAILITTLSGHSNGVYDASFSPDCKALVSAGADLTIRIWQLDASESDFSGSCKDSSMHRGQLGNRVITTLNSHTAKINKVAFSGEGQEEIIATASNDDTVKLWKYDGTLIQTLEKHPGDVNSVAFSPKGDTIATVSDGNTLKLWDRDGIVKKNKRDFKDDLLDVSFSPDGNQLAIGSKDNTITILNLNGNKLQEIESYDDKNNRDGHKDWVRAIAWSPDSKMIASASDDNTVKLWEFKNNQFEYKQTLKGHNSWVFDVKFSPDGNKIASSSNDKMVILWEKDQNTGKFTSQNSKKLSGHDDEVNGVSFSPDGKRIATVSDDKTVKLWDVNSGELWKTIAGHNEDLHSVSFSSDGKVLVLGSSDNTAILWNIGELQSYDNLENLIERGCKWLGNYLENNPNAKDDRDLCKDILTQK